MTGGEIAAASGVAKAMGKALKESEAVERQLLETAKDSPAITAAADAYAKRVAVKQQMRLNMWRPWARMLGVSRDYFAKDFAEDMTRKTGSIPDEHLVEPKTNVAGPAVVGLSYSVDEPDLKEMYLNLLATASDSRQSENAHPSFAEVIRQLSGGEARILNLVLRSQNMPVVRIKRIDPAGYTIVRTNLLNIRTAKDEPVVDPRLPVYVDNWIRLGLVTVSYMELLTAADAYTWVGDRPEMQQLRQAYEVAGVTLSHDSGILAPTEFGRMFAAAVTP